MIVLTNTRLKSIDETHNCNFGNKENRTHGKRTSCVCIKIPCTTPQRSLNTILRGCGFRFSVICTPFRIWCFTKGICKRGYEYGRYRRPARSISDVVCQSGETAPDGWPRYALAREGRVLSQHSGRCLCSLWQG